MGCPENIIGKGFDVNPGNINLTGRPKGARNRQSIYREHLEKKGLNGQLVDDCIMAAIDKALSGDIGALKELMDSGYGKNPDKLINAETTVENIDRDVTAQILKKIPTEELEEIMEQNDKSND